MIFRSCVGWVENVVTFFTVELMETFYNKHEEDRVDWKKMNVRAQKKTNKQKGLQFNS